MALLVLFSQHAVDRGAQVAASTSIIAISLISPSSGLALAWSSPFDSGFDQALGKSSSKAQSDRVTIPSSSSDQGLLESRSLAWLEVNYVLASLNHFLDSVIATCFRYWDWTGVLPRYQ